MSTKNEQFTPGIWEHFIQPARIGTVRTINSGTTRIADLKWLGIEETEANANLIAAAPDLYRALENLIEWCIQFTPEYPAALLNAKNALSKAKCEL